MKQVIILFFLLVDFTLLSAKDLIIMRSAEELSGDIELISNGIVTLLTEKGIRSIPTNQIYMIKYEKRGNAFFSPDSEMKYDTDKSQSKVSENNLAVYLIEGKEIVASALKMDGDKIKLKPVSKNIINNVNNFFSKDKGWIEIPRNDIFLIRYGDGSKDLVTPLQDRSDSKQSSAQPVVPAIHNFIQLNTETEFPYPGKLILKNGNELPVILYDDIDGYIYYRNKTWQDGPIFRINKNNIKAISGIK